MSNQGVTKSPAPLIRCGLEVIGSVPDVRRGRGKAFAGTFVPGPAFEKYRETFQRAVEAALQVDKSTTVGYLEAWHNWGEMIARINRLGLCFGEPGVPIEDFEIDGKWQVEFDRRFEDLMTS